MAADVKIHILTCSVEAVQTLRGRTLGSKDCGFESKMGFSKACGIVSDTPQVWVGTVSWLKAILTEDSASFVPSAVMKISVLIGEDFPVLDDALINEVVEALRLENKTDYDVADPERVLQFLNQYKGQKVFTVSW